MRDKNLEFEESLSKAEKRLIRANEIENLECLAAHLERLPRHCFHGNQMTGFGNYISAIIYDAWRSSRITASSEQKAVARSPFVRVFYLDRSCFPAHTQLYYMSISGMKGIPQTLLEVPNDCLHG